MFAMLFKYTQFNVRVLKINVGFWAISENIKPLMSQKKQLLPSYSFYDHLLLYPYFV